MSPDKPYEPRKKIRLASEIYACANRIYFITICVHEGRRAFIDAELNQGTLDILAEEANRSGCVVFTYCLMPDRLHFLVAPARDGISVLGFVNHFKSTSTRAAWETGWKGRFWQTRYYDHVVRSNENLREIAEYIVNNPVRKELARSSADWPWAGQMNPLPL